MSLSYDFLPNNSLRSALVCFVIDRSQSMSHKIDEINHGVKSYLSMCNSSKFLNVEVSLILFDKSIEVKSLPTSASKVLFEDISIGKGCSLIEAVDISIEIVEKHKKYYKSKDLKYFKPKIVVITDGFETEKPTKYKNFTNSINKLIIQNRFDIIFITLDKHTIDISFSCRSGDDIFLPTNTLSDFDFYEFMYSSYAGMSIENLD